MSEEGSDREDMDYIEEVHKEMPEPPQNADIGSFADMVANFGKDLTTLHKETEALKVKALLYNNKYIVIQLVKIGTQKPYQRM